jgi:hypothetical protein
VAIESVACSLSSAAGTDKYAQVGPVSASGKTVKIHIWDASDAALSDVAADADSVVYFQVWCRNSKVGE